MRKRFCCGALLVLLVGGISLSAALYGLRYQILSWYGTWLTGEVGNPSSWEVMFVLSGRPFERGIAAATFWQAHPKVIFLTGGIPNDNLLAAGCLVHTECEMTRQALIAHCVPDTAIHLLCEGTSTYEEVLLIRRLCQARGYRRIAIVSSVFHGRRIHLLARRYLSPAGIQIHFLPARSLLFHPQTWWTNEYGFLNAFEETLKLIYYQIQGIL